MHTQLYDKYTMVLKGRIFHKYCQDSAYMPDHDIFFSYLTQIAFFHSTTYLLWLSIWNSFWGFHFLCTLDYGETSVMLFVTLSLEKSSFSSIGPFFKQSSYICCHFNFLRKHGSGKFVRHNCSLYSLFYLYIIYNV